VLKVSLSKGYAVNCLKPKCTMADTKILLSGASYSEHKGSAALVVSSIANFKTHIPNSEFYFCSYTPDLDRKTLTLDRVYVIPYSLKARSLEFLVSAIYLPLFRNRSVSMPIINCIHKADIIVDISGDTFSSEYGTISIIWLCLLIG
jgi:hypothetical protein